MSRRLEIHDSKLHIPSEIVPRACYQHIVRVNVSVNHSTLFKLKEQTKHGTQELFDKPQFHIPPIGPDVLFQRRASYVLADEHHELASQHGIFPRSHIQMRDDASILQNIGLPGFLEVNVRFVLIRRKILYWYELECQVTIYVGRMCTIYTTDCPRTDVLHYSVVWKEWKGLSQEVLFGRKVF